MAASQLTVASYPQEPMFDERRFEEPGLRRAGSSTSGSSTSPRPSGHGRIWAFTGVAALLALVVVLVVLVVRGGGVDRPAGRCPVVVERGGASTPDDAPTTGVGGARGRRDSWCRPDR